MNKKAQIVLAIDAIEPLLEDDSIEEEDYCDLFEIHTILLGIKASWRVE